MAQGEVQDKPRRESDQTNDSTGGFPGDSNIKVYFDKDYSNISQILTRAQQSDSSRLQDQNQLGQLSIGDLTSTSHDQIYKSPFDQAGDSSASSNDSNKNSSSGASIPPENGNLPTKIEDANKPGQDQKGQQGEAPIEKQTPQEQRPPIDTNVPFANITPEAASKLLDKQAGKALPPIAERFENDVL